VPIEAVIFDLDGTLAHFNLDFKALRGDVRSYLIQKGIPASVLDVNESVFEMLKKAEIYIKNTDKNGKTKSFDEIRSQSFAIAEKYELEAAQTTSLLAGVVEALKELKGQNVKMGVCTINSEKATTYILQRFKIDEYFKVVVPRDKVKYIKPHTEQCEFALKALGVKAKSAIVVGDSVVDMQSANELKAIAVGLTTGVSTKEQLTSNGANYIITSLTDLSVLVKEINKA
jgi:HAD superfamily hydrolase (TIGR01549 family)